MTENNWQELIKPYKLSVSHSHNARCKGILIAEPLERGFGTTLGNALRRVLLSSLRGSAVTAVQIEGVLHEFSSISGVREDVKDIILNLKSLNICSHSSSPKKIKLNAEGPSLVTAGMIESNADIEILDPQQIICTLDKGAKISMELTVEMGKGYNSVSQRMFESSSLNESLPIGLILLDAHFSPVKKVSFRVENARVGQVTDYDKLIMEIQTNGFVTPEDAIGLAARILQDQLKPFINFDEADKPLLASAEKNSKLPFPKELLLLVDDIDLSLRAQNCLKKENVVFVGDLVIKTEAEMMRTPNFGRKSLSEISEVLRSKGLSLGMVVPEWPPKDIEQLIKNQESEQ